MNGQFLQKASAAATSDVSNTNRETAKFDQKILFSAILSAAENEPQRSRISQKPPGLLILLILIAFQMKNVSCFMFHTLAGVEFFFNLLFLEKAKF